MNHRSRVVLQFLISAIFVLTAKTVVACECPAADDTVLGKFENARFVVIARVTAVEKTGSETVHTKVVIEKVYKGNLRVGQELTFGQGESGSCFEDFDVKETDVKFLFYLNPKARAPRVW
jgi:hypothetical protein